MQHWVLDLANLAAASATAGALVLAYVTYKGSTNAQVFMEYTRRYAETMNAFPGGDMAAHAAFGNSPPPSSPALTQAVLRYLNMCSEEFYMHANGMLSSRVWRIWEGEIRRNVGAPLVVREWTTLRTEFSSFPAFCAFVEEAQRMGSSRAAG